MVSVSQNLSSLVSEVTERGDQDNDNLVNISSLLNKTASLFINDSVTSTEKYAAVCASELQY